MVRMPTLFLTLMLLSSIIEMGEQSPFTLEQSQRNALTSILEVNSLRIKFKSVQLNTIQ